MAFNVQRRNEFASFEFCCSCAGYVFSGSGIPSTFNFQTNNSGGGGGGGPASGGGKIKEARPPPAKQENPQKGPVDPSMLGLLCRVKKEPVSCAFWLEDFVRTVCIVWFWVISKSGKLSKWWQPFQLRILIMWVHEDVPERQYVSFHCRAFHRRPTCFLLSALQK